jgi:hypothetical protein
MSGNSSNKNVRTSGHGSRDRVHQRPDRAENRRSHHRDQPEQRRNSHSDSTRPWRIHCTSQGKQWAVAPAVRCLSFVACGERWVCTTSTCMVDAGSVTAYPGDHRIATRRLAKDSCTAEPTFHPVKCPLSGRRRVQMTAASGRHRRLKAYERAQTSLLDAFLLRTPDIREAPLIVLE